LPKIGVASVSNLSRARDSREDEMTGEAHVANMARESREGSIDEKFSDEKFRRGKKSYLVRWKL
jgi:hypothetical protein